MDRAYSLLEIKSVSPEARRFSGIASTPELDRQGDSVDPAGVIFRNPVPLLFHHDTKQPIGRVTLTATRDGILFDAVLPALEDPSPLKSRVDDAWACIKAGVISGVSIGFRILDAAIEAAGVRKILKSEICEVSLVTIPANANATILSVKALALSHKGPIMKQTAAEHIEALENKRAALAARMVTIMEATTDDQATLEPEKATEHDGLRDQVKSIDADLGRWREHEALQITKAVQVPAPQPGVIRPYSPVSVRPNVPPGIKLARFAIAKLASRLEGCDAAVYAEKRWNDSTPEVALAIKAAVAAGNTTDATWAKPLINSAIVEDFLPLLRAATIVGKIDGLKKVPFNVQVPSQTAGGTYNWVGELKPKPVTSLAFAMETLAFNKVAAIIVLSQELVRFSNPSAEALVRDDMVKGIAAFIDGQFINPAVAAVAGVNPASITNGAPTAAGTVSPLADILGLINHFATNGIPVDGLTFLLSPANALALSFRTNSDGSPEFPGIGINGGTYKGLQFITSNVLGTNVVGLQPGLILFADDGGVTIDASTEASLQMDNAPMSPVDATTVYASMFQMNAVALRAERYITWKRVGTNSVKYLTAVAWPSPSGTSVTVATGKSKE